MSEVKWHRDDDGTLHFSGSVAASDMQTLVLTQDQMAQLSLPMKTAEDLFLDLNLIFRLLADQSSQTQHVHPSEKATSAARYITMEVQADSMPDIVTINGVRFLRAATAQN